MQDALGLYGIRSAGKYGSRKYHPIITLVLAFSNTNTNYLSIPICSHFKMQSMWRGLRRLPAKYTRSILPYPSRYINRNMSFWSNWPVMDRDFERIFRLMDDWGNYRQLPQIQAPQSIRAIKPRFDVSETKESFELQGELPGVEQKDIDIEFTDPHHLVIKGHI